MSHEDKLHEAMIDHLLIALHTDNMYMWRQEILAIAAAITRSLKTGGRVYAMGNGGSASQAEHFVAELVGRFEQERDPWPAVALTANSANVTAVSNDYGYDNVFEHQVKALVRPDDVVIGISTSGMSQSVVAGLLAAQHRHATTVGLTGRSGGTFVALGLNHLLLVNSPNTARIQEFHIMMLHLIAQAVELMMAEDVGG